MTRREATPRSRPGEDGDDDDAVLMQAGVVHTTNPNPPAVEEAPNGLLVSRDGPPVTSDDVRTLDDD